MLIMGAQHEINGPVVKLMGPTGPSHFLQIIFSFRKHRRWMVVATSYLGEKILHFAHYLTLRVSPLSKWDNLFISSLFPDYGLSSTFSKDFRISPLWPLLRCYRTTRSPRWKWRCFMTLGEMCNAVLDLQDYLCISGLRIVADNIFRSFIPRCSAIRNFKVVRERL